MINKCYNPPIQGHSQSLVSLVDLPLISSRNMTLALPSKSRFLGFWVLVLALIFLHRRCIPSKKIKHCWAVNIQGNKDQSYDLKLRKSRNFLNYTAILIIIAPFRYKWVWSARVQGAGQSLKTKSTGSSEYSSCRREFSKVLLSHSNKPIPSHCPSLTVEMLVDTGAGDRLLQISGKPSRSVITCGSLTNHTDREDSRTPNCRQQACQTLWVWMKSKEPLYQATLLLHGQPPVSHTYRAWGQMSRECSGENRAHVPAFLPFLFLLHLFLHYHLPYSASPQHTHPVKHIKPVQNVEGNCVCLCLCIAAYDIYL